MLYKIIETFGPDHDGWKSYNEWRGLNLTSFDSVGGIMCPDQFCPESDEDWRYCVQDNYKTNILTDLQYTLKILPRYPNSKIIGVDIELDTSYTPKENLLGFDIIDGYCDVSLLTNWGTDEEVFYGDLIQKNGLLKNLNDALRIKDTLQKKVTNDSHVDECSVWAIYKIP